MYSSSTIFPTSLPTIPKPVNIFSYLTFPSFIHHSPFTYLCPSNHQSIKSSMIYPTLAHPPFPIPTCQPSSIHPSSLSTNLSTSLPIPLSSTKPFGQYHLFYPPANPTIQSLHVPTTSSSDIPYTYHHSPFIFQLLYPSTNSSTQLLSSFIYQPLPLPPTPHLLPLLSLPKSFIHPPKYPTPLHIYYPSLLTHTSTLQFMGLSFLHL